MNSFKEALEQDLSRAKLDRKALAEALGISVQAVGKWVSTAGIPPARREEVAKLLGADALVLTSSFAPVPQLADEEPAFSAVKASRPTRARVPFSPTGVGLRLSLASHIGPLKARYVEQRVPIGLGHRYFDFLSPRLAAQMVIVRAPSTSEEMFLRLPSPHYGNALLSLALLSKVAGGIEGLVYCLVVVNSDRRPIHPIDYAKLTSEAGILGVTVQRVGSVQEAASYLNDLDASLQQRGPSMQEDPERYDTDGEEED